ncbi:hypothetical protein B0H16DRAFT_1559982, partial [Mycena metata]
MNPRTTRLCAVACAHIVIASTPPSVLPSAPFPTFIHTKQPFFPPQCLALALQSDVDEGVGQDSAPVLSGADRIGLRARNLVQTAVNTQGGGS